MYRNINKKIQSFSLHFVSKSGLKIQNDRRDDSVLTNMGSNNVAMFSDDLNGRHECRAQDGNEIEG